MYRIQIGQIGGSQSEKKLVLGAITKKIKKKNKTANYTNVANVGDRSIPK